MQLRSQLDAHLSDRPDKQLTDQEFIELELSMGISADNPDFVTLCEITANQLAEFTEIKSVLDYGAGIGVYANALHGKGYEVKVFELFEAHREYIKSHYPHLQIVDKPVNTDCLLWIEVSEHMTDKEIDKLFKTIKPKYIYHSSTSEVTEHDHKWGHINIKSQDDWVKLFERKGYQLIKSVHLPTEWSKIYKQI